MAVPLKQALASAPARTGPTGHETRTVTVRFAFRTPRHQYALMLVGLGMVAVMLCHAVVLCLRPAVGPAGAVRGPVAGDSGVEGGRGEKSD